MAADADRTRRLYKALQKHATIVECYGLRGARDARVDLRQVARQAEQLVRQAVVDAGQQIDPAAARLVGERAGTDIAQLRGDVERLLLYAAGKQKISMEDVLQVVSAESAQDDWAVRRHTAQRRGRAPSAWVGDGAAPSLHDPGQLDVVRGAWRPLTPARPGGLEALVAPTD